MNDILRLMVAKNHGTNMVYLWTMVLAWLFVSCGGTSETNVTIQPADDVKIIQTADTLETVQDADQMIMPEQNYIYTVYDTTANILNIVNMSQFRELICCQEVMDALAVDNYALLPDSLPQLFQVYQQNDLMQIPNFVTVDLMVQLSHVYETYLLRTVEENHFAPMLTELCLALYQVSVEQVNKATREDVKNMAAFNAAFFAVPYHLLTGKSLKLSSDYQTMVEEELAYIAQQENRHRAFPDIKTDFDYSVFKPFGHYTSTAGLRRYFRAWKWLQLAPYCSNDKAQLQRAVLAALSLQTAKTQSGEAVMDVYSRLFEAMGWFVGQPAYGSLLDVSLLLKKEHATSITAALDAKMLAKVGAMIEKASSGNTAAVKHAVVCRNSVYFFPQPAYLDDELLHAMTDATPDAPEAFPKVSDIFTNERIYHFKDWNFSSYNKRLECLLAMQQKAAPSPVFAQKQTWSRKKLETALASWVKMKHNVSLYGVIPDHREPLSTAAVRDTFPAPVRLGYVEPALSFWTKLREWVELTNMTMKKYQLTTDTLVAQTELLHNYIALIEDAAQKELNNEGLDDDTYRFIAHIGEIVENLTLSMITPKIDRWEWTAGTDKSIAIFEKVYRRDIAGCPKNGDLYAATGNVSNIYVVVEIDGYLYLTKGAVFNYHEFSMPKGKELNETDWENILLEIHP